jgi:predicted DNA binding CopG/RHH family protein
MAKTHSFVIRLSEEEFSTLKAEAEKKGESMAEILRQFIHRLPQPSEKQ